jgi:hypothetical protein
MGDHAAAHRSGAIINRQLSRTMPRAEQLPQRACAPDSARGGTGTPARAQ